MILECTAWAPTRAAAEQFMAAVGITDAEGNPMVDVQIDHIGPIDETEGHHVNVRYYGDSAQALIEGLPQTDENGMLLDLFDRTHILDMVDARTGIQLQWQITRQPIPPGYEYQGIRLFDPSLIGSRSRVWA